MIPPITGQAAGDGMFLLVPGSTAMDRQDVSKAADALAAMIAVRVAARRWPATVGLPDGLLSDPAVSGFWTDVVAALPLLIPHPAAANPTPVSIRSDVGGQNPVALFAAGLLESLGDAVTPQGVGAIAAWAAGEGSCARNNPLDTTQPASGATPFNTLGGGGHVWNYPSSSEGIQATVATLRNGLYGGILAVLANRPTPASLEAAVRASPWGTGRFGSTAYSGARCTGSGPPPGSPVDVPPPESTGTPALIVARAAAYQAAMTAPMTAEDGGPPTAVAAADIPGHWLVAVRTAAVRFAVPWTLVAAVLKDTCDFGRSPAPGCQPAGSAGAGAGFALLTADTWRSLPSADPFRRDGPPETPGGGYATDGDDDGRADPWSVADASASCARRLADLGAGRPDGLTQAVFAYLHGPTTALDPADRVTAEVLERSADYGDGVSAGDGYTLPLDRRWYTQHPDWFARPHHDYPAVDIPVPAGTQVFAVTSSTVIAADESGGGTECGHDVRLRDPAGDVYTYCHGSQVLVSVGQRVAAGQVIMRSGWSGHVLPSGPAGAHLHFQINLAGHAGSSCPHAALVAWAAGRQIDLRSLAATGCVSGGPA